MQSWQQTQLAAARGGHSEDPAPRRRRRERAGHPPATQAPPSQWPAAAREQLLRAPSPGSHRQRRTDRKTPAAGENR